MAWLDLSLLFHFAGVLFHQLEQWLGHTAATLVQRIGEEGDELLHVDLVVCVL